MSFSLVSKAIHTKGLTSTEKLVLIALCDFSDDKKYQCYPSHASIAEICCLSEMSAIRSIKTLIMKGFVSKENRKQKGGYSSNLYTILSDNFDAFQMPLLPQGTATIAEGGTNTELLGVLTQCEGGTNTESENPITEPIIINQSMNQSDSPHSPPRGKDAKTLFSKSKNTQTKQDDFTPPDGIDAAVWRDYEAMRKLIRKPLTAKAKELVVKKLIELNKQTNQCPNDILNQSIMNSWQGVFPIKENQTTNKQQKDNHYGINGKTSTRERALSAIERLQEKYSDSEDF